MSATTIVIIVLSVVCLLAFWKIFRQAIHNINLEMQLLAGAETLRRERELWMADFKKLKNEKPEDEKLKDEKSVEGI